MSSGGNFIFFRFFHNTIPSQTEKLIFSSPEISVFIKNYKCKSRFLTLQNTDTRRETPQNRSIRNLMSRLIARPHVTPIFVSHDAIWSDACHAQIRVREFVVLNATEIAPLGCMSRSNSVKNLLIDACHAQIHGRELSVANRLRQIVMIRPGRQNTDNCLFS